MPAKPRWLLSIPDAISQLEQLDRTLLTPARHRAALRRLQGPRRRAHADLRGRDDRQPTDPAPDEAPAAAQEAPAAGRVPRRGGETSPLGRRAPESPADRGPVQGARRNHERAVFYQDVSFELNCNTEWNCYGSSDWLSPNGGGDATSAEIRISVQKYQVEVCELDAEDCF